MANNRTAESGSSVTPEVRLEPSGRSWVSEYRGADSLDDLRQPFRGYAEAFIGALRAAGATVTISATYRPPKRACLMHWCWKIARNQIDPKDVPAMDGVPISWKHYDREQKYSLGDSVAAAQEMVRAFQMQRLGVAPSLKSRHTVGRGIDMAICWEGDLVLADGYGHIVKVTSLPRTGMNLELHRVGASYGVIKYNRSGRDDPHWSDMGA